MASIKSKDRSIINVTTIRFDENLKNFISRVKDSFDMSQLQSRDFKTLQLIQDLIRDRMFNHQNILNFNSPSQKLTKSHKSHPNFFALMLSLISDLTKCETWLDVIKQNTFKNNVTLSGFENEIEDDIASLDKYKCACNHICEPCNQYLLSNQYTNLNLLIGCNCIEKNKILNIEDIKELKKRRNFDKNYKKLLDLYENKKLNKKKYKEYLKMIVINKFIDLIRNRNEKIKKVINFMKYILRDKIDFQKYKDKNISWYRFTKLSKKNIEYKKYIEFVLSSQMTNPKRKNKLNFYLQF
jgi:hypothetical protein